MKFSTHIRAGACRGHFIVAALLVLAVLATGRTAIGQEYESVYAPPRPLREDEGTNLGGVHLDLKVSYLTDYVFRGLDKGELISATDPADPDPVLEGADTGHEDSPNMQVDSKLEFDLGRAPHPFVGVFVNTFEADPESRFQEIRPFVGLEWVVRPFMLEAGHNSFIFPDRDELNTTEVWGQITLDDSYFYRSDEPLLSPYVFAAYDYDLYNGLYLEAGVQHAFVFEGTGLTLTTTAHAAYVNGHQQFVGEDPEDSTGFQHYQIGLVGTYALNPLLNIPRRYGEWTLEGYLFYTDRIEKELAVDTQLWGGVGIGFRY